MKLEDKYFDAARQMPLLVSLESVKQMVKIKGVTPPPRNNWWNLNSFIMTATTLLIASISVWLWNSNNAMDNTFPNDTKYSEKVNTTENNKDAGPQKEESFVLKKLEPSELGMTLAPEEEIQVHDLEIQKLDTKEIEVIKFEKELKSGKSAWWPNSDGKLTTAGKDLWIEKKKDAEPVVKDSISEVKGESKSLVKTYALKREDWFKLKNVNGDITVKTWERAEVKMEVQVTLKAKNEEEELLLLDDFDVNFVSKKGTLGVERKWDEFTSNGCNCQLEGMKIKTDNGDKIKVKNISVDYVITLPKNLNLDVKDNYGGIVIPDMDGEVVANVFQGKLSSGNFTGDLKLTAKYSNVILSDFDKGIVSLFQSNIEMGSSKELDLNAKYSKVEMQKTEVFKLYAFQSNLKLNEDLASLNADLKYGKFETDGNLGLVSMKMFQSKFFAHDIDSLNISSSYSTVSLGNVGGLRVSKSFQDKYKVMSASAITGKGQYSTLDVGTISNKLIFYSFQGKVNVKEVKSTFSIIDIESKYTPVSLKFEDDSKYKLHAKTAYSRLNYPENGFTVSYRDRQNQKLSLTGEFNSGKAGEAALVNLNSFQGNLELK